MHIYKANGRGSTPNILDAIEISTFSLKVSSCISNAWLISKIFRERRSFTRSRMSWISISMDGCAKALSIDTSLDRTTRVVKIICLALGKTWSRLKSRRTWPAGFLQRSPVKRSLRIETLNAEELDISRFESSSPKCLLNYNKRFCLDHCVLLKLVSSVFKATNKGRPTVAQVRGWTKLQSEPGLNCVWMTAMMSRE